MVREVDRSVTMVFDPDEFRPGGLHPSSPWGYSMTDAPVFLVNARTDDERYRHEQDVVRANRVEHDRMTFGVETVDPYRV